MCCPVYRNNGNPRRQLMSRPALKLGLEASSFKPSGLRAKARTTERSCFTQQPEQALSRYAAGYRPSVVPLSPNHLSTRPTPLMFISDAQYSSFRLNHPALTALVAAYRVFALKNMPTRAPFSMDPSRLIDYLDCVPFYIIFSSFMHTILQGAGILKDLL